MDVIIPGTFDPLTLGHEDIIRRSLNLFSSVIVAVAQDSLKNCLFNLEERVSFIEQSFPNHQRLRVTSFSGLLVQFARDNNIRTIVRGVRSLSDFEYEFQMALTNHQCDSSIETLVMVTDAQYSYLSSRLIRQISSLNGDISSFVAPHVAQAFQLKDSSH